MPQVTIQGVAFNLDERYTEGYTISANEAAALNQTRFENIRNNFAKTVKDAQEAAQKEGKEVDVKALQKSLTEYANGYEFGVRSGGGGAPRDPVGKAALAIATERVEQAIRGKGHTLADVGRKRIRELANDFLEKNLKAITKLAEERVAAASAIKIGDLDI